MKKLLIASLALGMLIVFTGVASAQSWWLSSTEITSVLTGLKEKTLTNDNIVLSSDSRTFKGYMVMLTSTDTVPATDAIEEVFFCGTVTHAGVTKAIEVEFMPPFASIDTDTVTLAKHPHNETGHILSAGQESFIDQTDSVSGPAYMLAAATFDLNDATVIEHITISGSVGGGFPQSTAIPPATDTIFTGAFSTKLTPYPLADSNTTVQCCAGQVTQTTGTCPP